jgi:hypothetical protein
VILEHETEILHCMKKSTLLENNVFSRNELHPGTEHESTNSRYVNMEKQSLTCSYNYIYPTKYFKGKVQERKPKQTQHPQTRASANLP